MQPLALCELVANSAVLREKVLRQRQLPSRFEVLRAVAALGCSLPRLLHVAEPPLNVRPSQCQKTL